MKISVVIPLYNKRTTIIRTLNSIFKQTVLPLEIVVVNDGSTDGSELVVKEINNALVKLINQPNTGVSSARNTGITMAKGDWIAFIDADDEWMPEYLEKIKILALTYPQCKVLATSYYVQDYLGFRKTIKLQKIIFKEEQGILINYFEVASSSYPPIWTSAVTVNREAILSIGGFPIGIQAGEDLLTWARLAIKYEIAYLIKPYSIFNLDYSHLVSNKPTRMPEKMDYVGNELKMLYDTSNGKIRRDIRKYLSLWFKMRASVYLRTGDKLKVWRYSSKSLKYNFLNYKNYIFLILSLVPLKCQKLIARIYLS